MRVELSDLDSGSLEDMIGTDCYETALGYVRRQAVSQQLWIDGQNALFGVVYGRYGEFFTSTVYFSRRGPMLEVRGAQCSCDARYACEHAAALLISAVEGGADAAGKPATPRQARRPPAWDTSLESLLAAGHDAGRPGETALAIELTLVADQPQGQLTAPGTVPAQAPVRPGIGVPAAPARPPVRLMARLVQPGKNGGWIGGTLSWATSTATATSVATRPPRCGCCGKCSPCTGPGPASRITTIPTATSDRSSCPRWWSRLWPLSTMAGLHAACRLVWA